MTTLNTQTACEATKGNSALYSQCQSLAQAIDTQREKFDAQADNVCDANAIRANFFLDQAEETVEQLVTNPNVLHEAHQELASAQFFNSTTCRLEEGQEDNPEMVAYYTSGQANEALESPVDMVASVSKSSAKYARAKNFDEVRYVFEDDAIALIEKLTSILPPSSREALENYELVIVGETGSQELTAFVLGDVKAEDDRAVNLALAIVMYELENYECPKMYDRDSGQENFTVELVKVAFNDGPQVLHIFG